MTKQNFVKAFNNFILDTLGDYYSDIKNIVYSEEDGQELMYINYKDYTQKWINISCADERTIMLNFLSELDNRPEQIPLVEEAYYMWKERDLYEIYD